MEKIKLIATASFGLEAIVRDELKDLGYENLITDNGKVEFEGTFMIFVKQISGLELQIEFY